MPSLARVLLAVLHAAESRDRTAVAVDAGILPAVLRGAPADRGTATGLAARAAAPAGAADCGAAIEKVSGGRGLKED